MTPFEQQLLNYLVRQKAVSSMQAKRVQERAQKENISIEAALGYEPTISQDTILRAKGAITKNETGHIPEGSTIPADVLQTVPEEAVRMYQFVPLAKMKEELIVGMVNPEDAKARAALRFAMLKSALRPRIVVVTEQDFRNILNQYRDLSREVSEVLAGLEQKETASNTAGAAFLEEETSGELKEAPITKTVSVILKHAIEGNASDIHIEPTTSQTHVRFRQEGMLHTSLFLPSSVHGAIVARIKILSHLRLDESRVPQDGRFHAKIDDTDFDFRVSTFPTAWGEKIAIRILSRSAGYQKLSDLGLMDENLRHMQEALRLPFGSILVSGPTGSGKSTTLYALLHLLPREKANIVTLEDPIEYFMEGVNQSQVRPEIGYTFASGLRHILRQDPDIIMVGEIRDEETAELSTHAALTGHLVLSTIHTNNAVGVILRLIDMGVHEYLLPSSLALAVAQRLVRRLCDYCKYQETPPAPIAKIIEDELRKLPESMREKFGFEKPYTIWRAEGCVRCGRKGYRGRIGMFEALRITPEIKRIIIEHAEEGKITEVALREGMTTLRQDGIIKALRGLVSMEEVLRTDQEGVEK